MPRLLFHHVGHHVSHHDGRTDGRTDKGILGVGYHFYQTFERCPGGQILQYKLSHQGVFYEGGCCVERNNSFCDQHHLLIRQLEEGAVVLVENVFLIICRICIHVKFTLFTL